MPQPPYILIVDDEPEVRMMLRMVLERAGYRTEQAVNGLQAVNRCCEEKPDLVVMDVMMPLLDGIEACRRIRQFSNLPVILLTACDEEELLVAGFSAGAFDFLTKPFRPRELLARVAALLRREQPPVQKGFELPSGPPQLRYADLSLDLRTREVLRGGASLNVTANSFHLLQYFMHRPGEVITKESLLREVWETAALNTGPGPDGGNMIEAAIKRLRKELGDDSRQPRYIKTIWGVGYKFGEQPENVK
jgi:DNA-binding response OmpR family regulator